MVTGDAMLHAAAVGKDCSRRQGMGAIPQLELSRPPGHKLDDRMGKAGTIDRVFRPALFNPATDNRKRRRIRRIQTQIKPLRGKHLIAEISRLPQSRRLCNLFSHAAYYNQNPSKNKSRNDIQASMAAIGSSWGRAMIPQRFNKGVTQNDNMDRWFSKNWYSSHN